MARTWLRSFSALVLVATVFMAGSCRREEVATPTAIARDSPATADAGENPVSQDAPAPSTSAATSGASSSVGSASKSPSATPTDAPPATFEALKAQRDELDRTVWSPEVDAQRHEDRIVQLWDALRAADDPWEVFQQIECDSIRVYAAREQSVRELGITESRLGASPRDLRQNDIMSQIDTWRQDGYHIVQTEWHHTRFARTTAGAESLVSFAIDVERSEPQERLTLRGNLRVVWRSDASLDALPQIAHVDAQDVTILTRSGAPVFEHSHAFVSEDRYPRLMPLLLYDLDGNGLSEIILGGNNRVLWNEGHGKFRADRLSSENLEIYDAAVLADFNGDGHVDLICVDRNRYPLLLAGDATGHFGPSRRCADYEFTLPKVFTAGDVDGDGDLDLWVGQYKFAYQGGAMPTPFYDAMDGDPSVLLINDGNGAFTDGTDAAGLAAKRTRRTYSASLVDLDADRDLDLWVVSDYAGVDFYENDGKGRFRDVTQASIPEPHLFGMSHSVADFNGDGLLDVYAIGMSSTTARRLDALKLGRDDHPDINQMRQQMGYGNRMYLGRREREVLSFVEPPFARNVARTGWSWGTSAPDFDNDRDRDIYVVNGHSSGKSAKDYCTRFWCHDIYTGSSQANREVFKLFGDSLKSLRTGEISWNGFEHNVLLVNEHGHDFFNAAFVLGVADEFDSRGAVSDDWDGDGRCDLLVIESHEQANRTIYTLHLLKNNLRSENHWIGIRLEERVTGHSPIGARIVCTSASGSQVATILNGDSFSSQHAPVAHFGLGSDEAVQSLVVSWLDGETMELKSPAIDRYHTQPLQPRP